MRNIWKYRLYPTDELVIQMPSGAQILDVQMQNGEPFVWALVDPANAPVPRRLRVVGTGHPIPDRLGPHIGTFQMNGGALVFHVFDQPMHDARG